MAIEFADVQQIMADVFGVELQEISMESTPDTIESWDSLRLLNLVLALEQEFKVEISPDQLPHLLSVSKIMQALNAVAHN